MMARTRCWACLFFDDTLDYCSVAKTYGDEDDTCIATDEQLASAAAQIAALQRERELERHKPEERVGRCTCGVCCHSDGRWWEQRQIGPAEDDLDARPLPSRWRRCPHCGDPLDRNAVARRNADAARVQRDGEAMQLLRDRASRGGTVQLYSYGMELKGGDLWRCQRSVGEPDDDKSTANDPADAIRAALDPEVGDSGVR